LVASAFFAVESAVILLVTQAEQYNNLGAHPLFARLKSFRYECSTVTRPGSIWDSIKGDVEGEKRVKTKKNFHFTPLRRSTIRMLSTSMGLRVVPPGSLGPQKPFDVKCTEYLTITAIICLFIDSPNRS